MAAHRSRPSPAPDPPTGSPEGETPRQSPKGEGETKLTNHRAARILHVIGCGCYRETAAELAGVTRETLSDWLRWEGEPYLAPRLSNAFVRRKVAELGANLGTN